ncbi:SU(VAR)3-9 homolog 5 [Actinidia rufa]|uniref:SU(VAR)3-9 homolog 5 n=1 Tax=Actinidia rufa TaxID=165716 RepID=A0A7J0FTN4_9ERIC|nr:SU(VAR)3-9 homolog 5 [Actinidia rufa]
MGTLSNGGLLCDERSSKRLLENGYCSSSVVALKYKKRKVSAVRDFPPGCGRNAPRINLKPKDTEAVASISDKENLVDDEKRVNVATEDCVKSVEIGNELLLHQVVKSPVRLELPNSLDDLVGKVVVAAGVKVELSPIVELPKGLEIKAPELSKELHGAEVPAVVKSEVVLESKTVLEIDSMANGVVPALEIKAPELSKELHDEEVPAVVKREGVTESKTVLEIGSMANGVVRAGSMANGVVPAGVVKSWSPPQWPISDANNSKSIALKNKPPRRRTVSAVRDFPPFCGRNAPCLPEEERLRIALRKKTVSAPEKAVVQGVEELNVKVRVGNSQKEIEGSGTEPKSESQNTAVQGKLSTEKLGIDVEGGLVRETKAVVEEPNKDFQERIAQEKKLEGSVAQQKMKAQKVSAKDCEDVNGVTGEVGKQIVVTGKDYEDVNGVTGDVGKEIVVTGKDYEDVNGVAGEVGKEIVVTGKDYEDVNGVAGEVGKEIAVYPGDKSFKGKSPMTDVALGHVVERVIVQGLMAAPNCPWRHGKGAINPSLGSMITGSEPKTPNVSSGTGREKSKYVSRAKVNEGDSLRRKVIKKKLLPSEKAENKGEGPLVAKDEEDFTTKKQDEGSSGGRRTLNFEVTLPPFGPNGSNDGDARNKVRMTLRLFQAIFRKLLQEEESLSRQKGETANQKRGQKGDSSRRIDLQAAQIVREKRKEVDTEKYIIGSVPGVEVGDEFQYRVELALVGIHRLYQSGIDFKKNGGMAIALSVVASGAYDDDLDNPDVLIYSGQGGNLVGRAKKPEDQKLERGNLALKNSILTRNPVRVVRGFKEAKAANSDARTKIVTSYTYDGLYTVERYWHDIGKQGSLVYMFELRRIPGQPELAWKEVKKSNKSKIREGRCVDDISGGKELFPICAVNTIDNEIPPTFNYISEMKYPDWYSPTPPKGCDCVGGCSDFKKCSCVVKNGEEIPFNYNGAIVEAKPLVYECGPSCKCPPSCHNRVSQHGIKIQLEIFKTESRGWGVRSLTFIPSGSFICEYTGELLEDKEAEQRHNDEYLFDIGKNLSDCSFIDGPLALKPDAQNCSKEVEEDSGFTIDAAQFGNVGRFINHSCSPNLYAQNVLYDHEDKKMPHIMLFAAENIPPLQELTYHYNYSVDQVHDSSGNIKVKNCYCGSAECTGRMY